MVRLSLRAYMHRKGSLGLRRDAWQVAGSVLDTLATFVEVFEELALVLVLDVVAVGETLVACIHSLPHWADLVEKNRAPDVTVLHIVESIVAASDELINDIGISHFVMLAPVSRQL